MRQLLARPILLALCVAVLAVLPFVPSVTGEYIYDDLPLIEHNEFVHGFEHAARWFTSHFWDVSLETQESTAQIARYWRPAVQASYALDWSLGGGSPLPFHLTNLLLQAAVAFLAFRFFSRWFDKPWVAAIATLFFVWHPSKAESVAWISGRPDVLCALGVLLALEGMAQRARSRSLGISLEVVGTALAYLSKEAAILLPVFAFLWALRRGTLRDSSFEPSTRASSPRDGALQAVGLRARTVWSRFLAGGLRWVAPQIAVALAYLGFRLHFFAISSEQTHFDRLTHLLFVFESWGRYFEYTFWPRDLSLGGAPWGASEAVRYLPRRGFALLGVVGLLGFGGLALLSWKKARVLSLGLGLYLISLLPVVNVAPMPASVLVAPRLLYLPLLGLALGVGWLVERGFDGAAWRSQSRGISSSLQGRPLQAALLLLSAFVLSVGAGMSASRSLDFTSEAAFWRYELAHNPRNEHARNYYIDRELQAGRPRAVLRLVRDALAHPSPLEYRSGTNLSLVVFSLHALLTLTPDLDRASLEQIQLFSRELSEKRGARLLLPQWDLELSSGRSVADPNPFLMMQAVVAGRLGEDDRAVQIVRGLRATCPRCLKLFDPALYVAAQSGDLKTAQWFLEQLDREGGAERIQRLRETWQTAQALVSMQPEYRRIPQLAAQYYILWRAWGRAYAAARSAIESNESMGPEADQVLAEIAFRAGDEAGARRVLFRGEGSPREDGFFAVLARDMQWSEEAPTEEVRFF